jgi:hypothetical protein
MAYSRIEDRYLSALTAVQFPDTPIEEQPAEPEKPVLLASAGAGLPQGVKVTGQIRPIEQTNFEKALQNAGMGLEQAGRFLDGLGQVQIPGTDIKISLADLVPFVGGAKERSVFGTTWQGTPMSLQRMGTSVGPMLDRVTTGTGVARQFDEDTKLGLAADLLPAGAAVRSASRVVTRGANAAGDAAVRAITGNPQATAMGVLDKAGQMGPLAIVQRPNVVSTRLPTAKKATEDPMANRLVIDLAATRQDPEAFSHNVNLVRQYPNFASKARTPDKAANDFIEEVKNNLLFLYDKVPQQTRDRSKLWYDGARNIVDTWAPQYSVPDQAIAGVLAVLSPQKDWFMNVSLGQRVLDIMTGQQASRWDASMDEMAKIIWNKPQYAPMVDAIRGKSLSEITDPGLKAMWLRTYDQANLPREHQIVTPEGTFAGTRLNANGTPTKTGWGSLNEIGKAIVILDDPQLSTISANLGSQHKVRNFYSNIYDPLDQAGPVTIDTHAVAAGLLRPLSGNSREVLHNFGSGVLGEGGPKNSAITGVQGTYGLYAEAYRRAAAERGILPREMQSITWEAVRGLFPDTFKAQAKNVEQIDSIWLQYRKGQISLEEARNEVLRAAGGIDAPEWERAGLRPQSSQAVQPAADAGELPGSGVSRGSPAGSGREQPAPRDSSSLSRGRRAPQSGAN